MNTKDLIATIQFLTEAQQAHLESLSIDDALPQIAIYSEQNKQADKEYRAEFQAKVMQRAREVRAEIDSGTWVKQHEVSNI